MLGEFCLVKLELQGVYSIKQAWSAFRVIQQHDALEFLKELMELIMGKVDVET